MLTEDGDKIIDFVSSLESKKFLKIENDLGDGYFRLNTSEAEKRQARHDIKCVEDCVIEMLRNSRDAGAKKIFISTAKKSDGYRLFRIVDDGQGIPKQVHEAVFEPRVTSKIKQIIEDRYGVHGRGMALYSIRSSPANLELLHSAHALGSIFKMEIDTAKLSEKKDQSSYPKIKKGEDGLEVKGLRNVLRLLVEFFIDFPDVLIYYGSPSEILATMIELGNKYIDSNQVNVDAAPFWARLSDSDHLEDLVLNAKRLFDIEVSTRNAHRILSGEISPLDSVSLDEIRERGEKGKEPDIFFNDKHFTKNILNEDIENFTQAIKQKFRVLEEKYFIKLADEPEVKCGKRKITISLSLTTDENGDI